MFTNPDNPYSIPPTVGALSAELTETGLRDFLEKLKVSPGAILILEYNGKTYGVDSLSEVKTKKELVACFNPPDITQGPVGKGFVSGRVESGNTLNQTILRELKEELYAEEDKIPEKEARLLTSLVERIQAWTLAPAAIFQIKNEKYRGSFYTFITTVELTDDEFSTLKPLLQEISTEIENLRPLSQMVLKTRAILDTLPTIHLRPDPTYLPQDLL